MARTHHPPMERTITFETRQFSVYVDRLDGNKRAEACCAQSFVIEQHDPSARPSPRDTASIASAIHELRSRCPHIEPPRFPPVVRRLHGALLGQKDTGVSSEGRESEGNNGKRRRCPDKHTLTTRHVVHERNVLALEVTKGRKRVYKKMQSSDKDKKPVDGCPGSFDMVQVRVASCQSSHQLCDLDTCLSIGKPVFITCTGSLNRRALLSGNPKATHRPPEKNICVYCLRIGLPCVPGLRLGKWRTSSLVCPRPCLICAGLWLTICCRGPNLVNVQPFIGKVAILQYPVLLPAQA